jgi:Cu/Ag efflux protein CusF
MRNSILAGSILALAALASAGCSKQQEAPATSSAAPAAAAAPATSTAAAKPAAAGSEQTYPMTAEVMGVDAANKSATLKNDTIDGFMQAMTMGYQVKDPAEMAKLKVGEKISATLHVSPDAMWINDVQTTKAAAPAAK